MKQNKILYKLKRIVFSFSFFILICMIGMTIAAHFVNKWEAEKLHRILKEAKCQNI
jgi:hypothetical protein